MKGDHAIDSFKGSVSLSILRNHTIVDAHTCLLKVCVPAFTNRNSALQFYSKTIKETEHCFNL
jgi:hypothetical protein